MNKAFKTVGIIGRVKNPGVKDTLVTLIKYLRSLQHDFVIEAETAEHLDDASLPIIERHEIGKRCNLLIVVGGDGSMLNAAHCVVNNETPVLGINRGSLGFLTDILPTQLEKIKEILNGEYILEKRFLLSAEINLQNEKLGEDDALNEVALIPNTTPHMIEFEIYIDDQFVCSQNSDGLIIATPTGSTAYALSGGGPILHPGLDAIVLVPMFPHTLSSRPIVIEGNRKINIIVSPNNTTTPRLSCDGQDYINTPPGSDISIYKKARHLQLIHPVDYNYYKTLRSKLHWGKKLHYSE
jgi:NAD+ kinase